MPTLISICGEGQSGSTMLDLMLGNGYDTFSCGEVYAWFRPWRTHHFRITCSCGKLAAENHRILNGKRSRIYRNTDFTPKRHEELTGPYGLILRKNELICRHSYMSFFHFEL